MLRAFLCLAICSSVLAAFVKVQQIVAHKPGLFKLARADLLNISYTPVTYSSVVSTLPAFVTSLDALFSSELTQPQFDSLMSFYSKTYASFARDSGNCSPFFLLSLQQLLRDAVSSEVAAWRAVRLDRFPAPTDAGHQ